MIKNMELKKKIIKNLKIKNNKVIIKYYYLFDYYSIF